MNFSFTRGKIASRFREKYNVRKNNLSIFHSCLKHTYRIYPKIREERLRIRLCKMQVNKGNRKDL